MSKRDSTDLKLEGHSIFVADLQEMGYIPEGVLNWIALMGASFDDAEDVFSLADLVQRFRFEHLNPSPAAINFEKADHFNGTHIRRLTVDDLAGRLRPFFEKAGFAPEKEALHKVAAVLQVRIVTLEDAIPMGGFFFRGEVTPDPKELVGKGLTPLQCADALSAARDVIAGQASFDPAAAEERLREIAERFGWKPGMLFGILRVAVTGQTVSPPLFASMEIVGRETVLRRVSAAEKILRGMQP
jgi:glutamyl-tRNA synthetase